MALTARTGSGKPGTSSFWSPVCVQEPGNLGHPLPPSLAISREQAGLVLMPHGTLALQAVSWPLCHTVGASGARAESCLICHPWCPAPCPEVEPGSGVPCGCLHFPWGPHCCGLCEHASGEAEPGFHLPGSNLGFRARSSHKMKFSSKQALSGEPQAGRCGHCRPHYRESSRAGLGGPVQTAGQGSKREGSL